MRWLSQLLDRRGTPHVLTREPGGTGLGEKLRELLLHHAMHAETEALLMFAARRQHLDELILPELARGTWVVCDRFTDATFAYQGAGRGIAETKLRLLEKWVQGRHQPDLTLLFDVTPKVGRERSASARRPDRFELERDAFFRRVRRAYRERAAKYPQRIRLINAARPLKSIQKELENIVSEL